MVELMLKISANDVLNMVWDRLAQNIIIQGKQRNRITGAETGEKI